jgi:hypothetical protein
MFKMCQYATNDNKVLVGLILVDVTYAQIGLQKSITWTKKSGKGGKNGIRLALKVGHGIRS